MERNLKLDDMIRIMKESYDFIASPRGYKKKFKQWGWLKNAPVGYTTSLQGGFNPLVRERILLMFVERSRAKVF